MPIGKGTTIRDDSKWKGEVTYLTSDCLTGQEEFLKSLSFPRISDRLSLVGEGHYLRAGYAALIETGELTPVLHETHLDISMASSGVKKYSLS